jgi:cytochrome c oxidase cbb3-type subunit 2
MPQLQLGNQEVTELKETGELCPLNRAGVAAQGAEVYRSLGCAECHTRQVRPENLGGDIARGWGHRHSVAQDYIRDYPVLLGDLRVGPDLANAGLRYTNATELLKLLYKPQTMNAGGMPSYSFLFEKTHLKPGQRLAANALQIEGEAPEMEILPKAQAQALVAYIQSLRADVNLFEAPLPIKPRPPGADTNAPPESPQPSPAAGASPAPATPAAPAK